MMTGQEQAKPVPVELTDAEMVEFVNDPTVGAEALALLTPGEKARYQTLKSAKPEGGSFMGSIGKAIDVGEDVATGVVKGAGQTAFNLGNLVHSIPGIGDATDALAKLFGGAGTDPDQAFAQTPQDLQPTNTAQAFGKGAEQIGEFFIPAGKVGMASRGAADLVGKLPKAAGTVRKAATDLAWKGAPVVDNALSTGAVAAAHGDEDPQYAAGTQALLQSLGIGAGQASKLLGTMAGKQYAPILAGVALFKLISALGGDIGTSAASGLAANQATRTIARRYLSQPGAQGKMLFGAERAGEKLGTAGAGIVDETRRRRRDQQ